MFPSSGGGWGGQVPFLSSHLAQVILTFLTNIKPLFSIIKNYVVFKTSSQAQIKTFSTLLFLFSDPRSNL